MTTADALIARLGLAPHPEGGFYRETWRDHGPDGARGHGTAIYFLLRAGDRHRWHRVDAVEIWHHYAGAPLTLAISDGVAPPTTAVLGDDLAHDQRPQAIVPAGWWQQAQTQGPWTLVGCTVSPAFVFDRFEIAPPGWTPPGA